MTRQMVTLCGILFIFFVIENVNNIQTQAMTPATLTSKANESNSTIYFEGFVFVNVIIFADTNINGALRNVHATIAEAI